MAMRDIYDDVRALAHFIVADYGAQQRTTRVRLISLLVVALNCIQLS